MRISRVLFCTDFADSRRVGRPPVSLELLPLSSVLPRQIPASRLAVLFT
jgi:hypothetical protein